MQRVTLEGGPYLVVLDKPEATVKVPVGRYRPAKVCLKKGDAEAYLDRPDAGWRRADYRQRESAGGADGGRAADELGIHQPPREGIWR